MNTTTIQVTPRLRSSRYSERRLFGYAAIMTRRNIMFTKTFSMFKKLGLWVIVGAMYLLINSTFLHAEPMTIDFNNVSKGSSVDTHTEKGMTFTPRNFPHFHSSYSGSDGNIWPHPQVGEVIRMTYDPNNDGVPDGRFNLIRLDIVGGEEALLNIHAEIDHSSVNGAVYGPWEAGWTWWLDPPGRNNLLFVDFAVAPGATKVPKIDNVVFEIVPGSTVPTSSCDGRAATIVGTPGNDTILGVWNGDVINGLSGNDTIIGFGGKDTICGGAGADTIYGGSRDEYRDESSDRLFGNSGDDYLDGQEGTSDFCNGGSHVIRDTAVNCESTPNVP